MALSQSEIEELINSMMKQSEKEQQSQVVKPRLRVYDFNHPDKFSKDNIRGVQLLFDSFARQITSYFSGIFRVAIQANLNSVDQLTFSEFAQGLTNPCCVAVLNWQSLPSSVLINLSPKIALPIVDRLCGGEGNTPIVSRVLTDIESALLKKIAQGMADILSDTMYEYRLGRHLLTVTSFEVNPLFIQQAFAPNDIVLSVVMVFKFGANSGNIEFCLPHVLLEPILPSLSAHRWFSRQDEVEKNGDSNGIPSSLEDVEIPISCRLGQTSLLVKDVLSLKEGDVIELDRSVKEPSVLTVLGKSKFRVKPGKVGNRMAAKIVGLVDVGEEM